MTNPHQHQRPQRIVRARRKGTPLPEGAVYEVYRYDERCRAEIITNRNMDVTLPHSDAEFEPYDPWAGARAIKGDDR